MTNGGDIPLTPDMTHFVNRIVGATGGIHSTSEPSGAARIPEADEFCWILGG